jgi:hypothetical protein
LPFYVGFALAGLPSDTARFLLDDEEEIEEDKEGKDSKNEYLGVYDSLVSSSLVVLPVEACHSADPTIPSPCLTLQVEIGILFEWNGITRSLVQVRAAQAARVCVRV